ncbi:hypothetical protein F8B43_5219 [Methylorubrum populi]|uniref:Uncharacterized protein n=1 Tax=Methylorubrum populi TaxID=223967 RepID=A0A833J1J5_9HYPH|nr:hypothetical protein F8B43_5219 [Methylorubrum populi]
METTGQLDRGARVSAFHALVSTDNRSRRTLAPSRLDEGGAEWVVIR